MKKFLIYVLIDPRTNAPRYVGRSSSGLRRPRQHIRESELRKCEHTHKAHWIRQLKALGLKYEISVVYSADVEDGLSEAEVFWIEELRRRGFKLTNSTDGGEGTLGMKLSEETRQKMSEAKKGRKLSEEHRQKISEAGKGQKRGPPSEEARRKMSEAKSGRKRAPLSEEHRRKLSEANKGQNFSEEARQKMSEAKKGRKLSEEHRQKISEARKSRKGMPSSIHDRGFESRQGHQPAKLITG